MAIEINVMFGFNTNSSSADRGKAPTNNIHTQTVRFYQNF